jgi:signal transduction histidine kinase
VESVYGEGSTFTVALPFGASHLPADHVGAPRPADAAGAGSFVEEALRWLPGEDEEGEAFPIPAAAHAADPDLPRARILLADDNADMRGYLHRLLAADYEVIPAVDGERALRAAVERKPDLVISDVMMPLLDGFGLLVALRADARTSGIPVIMLSARAGEEARVEGLQAGADDYLTKPFSARELLARVGGTLALARARREADRRKDEFLATLAHELRNPLAPIRNGLQILRLAKGDPAAEESARAVIERQVQQMVRLIDDLLDLSRISRGKVELRRERIALEAVVRSAMETSRPLIEKSGHRLTLDLPAEPLFVDADLTRLSQVVANLLNNAAKYTEPGGDIRLAVTGGEGGVTISVRDNGVGIPAPMLPQVFEMFTQVDRSLERSQGGLGIGLTLVKRLVEMHGGTVEARSGGHGLGSELLIRLPRLESAAAAAAERPFHAEPAAGFGFKRRILVADDNADSAASLEMMLEFMGNEVRTAHDGLQAVEAAAAFRPELILLDIGMPGMNGYDACREIRRQPWGRDAVIVALTGWGQDEDKRRSREAGFDQHLVKPVEPAALGGLLAALPPEGA